MFESNFNLFKSWLGVFNPLGECFRFSKKKKQNKTEQNRTEQNRTEQNRTKQNKTKQNKTKQKQNKQKTKTETKTKQKKTNSQQSYPSCVVFCSNYKTYKKVHCIPNNRPVYFGITIFFHQRENNLLSYLLLNIIFFSFQIQRQSDLLDSHRIL